MFCSRCGNKNDEGVQFCSSCGYDLKQTTPSSGESLPAGLGMPSVLVPAGEKPEAAAAESGDLAVGALVGGRYRIERKLGKGGMGAVYLATDERIARRVALKFITVRRFWQQRELYLRFVREVNVCLDLTHPNIVRVYHLDEWEGQPYLAMEYLEGLTLRDKMDRDKLEGGSLAWPLISAILQDLLIAVGYAHGRGVIHRDLKPANIMLARKKSGGWRLVVMDFGLAKTVEDESLTQTGVAMGTPYYIAPEQRSGAPVDQRADLYSLGVIAYEMLTGRLPAGHPDPPSKRRDDLPEGVDGWVFKAMALEPLERFASAKEMIEALRLIGVKKEVSPKIETKPKAEEPAEKPSLLLRERPEDPKRDEIAEAAHELDEENRKRRYRRKVFLALALSGLGMAVVGAVIWFIHEFAYTSSSVGPVTTLPSITPSPALTLAGPISAPIETPPPQAVQPTPAGPAMALPAATPSPAPTQAPPPKAMQPTPTATPELTPIPTAGARSPQDRARDYAETQSGLNLEMVWIPSGAFQMGSNSASADSGEKPVHAVTLDGFWIGKHEVTQRQYEVLMGTNPSKFKGPNRPVEQVSWHDAMQFCRKLSQATGSQYTLPTEAQWEYACRAGSAGEWCFGDDESQLTNYAWYNMSSVFRTHDVGTKKPNGWGLYDMHGNVYEWCADWHGPYSSGTQRNPTGAASNVVRVLRGGSWNATPRDMRSAFRGWLDPSLRTLMHGFRVCWSP